MSEPDRTLELLTALGDAGLNRPDAGRLSARVSTAIADEIDRERRAGPRRGEPVRHAGWALPAVTTAVTLLVALGAVLLLARAPRPTAASAQGLLARLAVLRRPQTAADRLPAGVRLTYPAGQIIPGLTRLVASPPGARLYLVVTTPASGSHALWPSDLGDQVSVVAVTATGATEGLPEPAADLDNAQHVARVGEALVRPGSTLPVRTLSHTFNVSILPDGVARVRWRLAGPSGGLAGATDARIAGNLAYLPVTRHSLLVARATWYGGDGHVIPSSDAALRAALAARDDALRAQLIRRYAHYAYRADPRLLAGFAVFAITSRAGVLTASGLTISHPRLGDIPYEIVNSADPSEPDQLDPSQIRQVTFPSGARVWIIAGRRGLCVTSLEQPSLPTEGPGGGGGEACSGSVRLALASGVGLSGRHVGGPTVTYGVLPRSRQTIRLGGRTIRPADGVYYVTSNR